ncbi:PorV/PorQ family protein [candidate division KSB1 bacterium]|nr:PorV/PorQ family protein [candidate division KSB1 bacterium]
MISKQIVQPYRHIMKLVMLLIGVGLMLATTGMAQSNQGIGKYGAIFLRVNPSARQVGMGEAFTGIADEVNLMRYNIGGLGSSRYMMGAINFHKWIDDTQQGSFGSILPTRYGVFGFELTYFNEGKLQEIDADYRPTGVTVESNDLAVNVGFGTYFRLLNNELSFGVSTKLIRMNWADESVNAYGLDLGMIYRMKYASFGATMQNWTLSKIKFFEKADNLPETIRGGIGINFPAGQYFYFNLDADIAYSMGQNPRYYTGGELIISNLIALRAGYKVHNTEASRWGTGFGLIIPMTWLAGSETRLDYAYSPLDAFETVAHRFSLVFTFGILQRVRSANVYDEKRWSRLIYEEEKINKMSQQLKEKLDAAEQSRKAAEEAKIAAQDAEKRTRELEELMKMRLDSIKAIASRSEGKLEVEEKSSQEIQINMRINFDFDSAVIRPDDYGTMHDVATMLNTYPGGMVHIAGHTDHIGTDEYNIRLSEERVASVLSFLTVRENVPQERFYMPIGYGEMVPLVDNLSEMNRFRNRRVEFHLYPNPADVKLPVASTVTDISVINDSTVHIVCNGKPIFSHHIVGDPIRLVVDLENTFLMTPYLRYPINRGLLVAARVGYHEDKRSSRVVFDLFRQTNYQLEAKNNILVVKIGN